MTERESRTPEKRNPKSQGSDGKTAQTCNLDYFTGAKIEAVSATCALFTGNYVSNAHAHNGNSHLLNVDIENFFPSINADMTKSVYLKLGYNANAAALLTALTTLSDEAPAGAPTSPAIGNIILEGLDVELSIAAQEHNITYTRYADDLTFSSKEFIENDFYAIVVEAVERNGFTLNARKTKFMGRGDRMEVTGLVINNGVNAPRPWRNSVRGFLHRVNLNPEPYIEDFDHVSGLYGTLCSLDPEHEKKLTKSAENAVKALKKIKGQE